MNTAEQRAIGLEQNASERFPNIRRTEMTWKSLLFVGVFFLLFALRYALGQDEGIGIEPGDYEDPAESIFGLMMAAPLLGALIGGIRVLALREAKPVLQPIRLN